VISGSRRWLSSLVLLLLGATLVGCATINAARADDSSRPPNIVILLADDAGYNDFGFMGSDEIRTPNLDRLARQGTVFDAAYATTPFCSPSRAGLLTGRYPQRFGFEFNLTHAPAPGIDATYMGLAAEELTLADLLKPAGYRTIVIGKWHLGLGAQFHPNARGFDHFYGFLDGSSRYLPLAVRPGIMRSNGDAAPVPAEYLTDDLAREAVAQIEASNGQPFFLYLAFSAPHTPMEALPADEARFAPILDPQRRRLAAMTWAMDRAVGRVLDALERHGGIDNTLVIFTNDNGGDRIGLDARNAPLRGTKGTLLEGGIRVPLVVRWPRGQMAGQRRSEPVSLMDIVPTALVLAGANVPDNLDGRTLGQPAGNARPLFWRYDSMAAMRQGAWKLLRFPDRPAELYDLSQDSGETRDLAEMQPVRLRAMMRELFAWEGTLSHPRWHTGTYWSQEDVRRYTDEYVAAEIAKTKAAFGEDSAKRDR